MPPAEQSKPAPRALAGFCVVMGLVPLLISMGAIPVEPGSVHAPRWVVGLAGLVFVVGGIMIFLGPQSGWSDALAAILLASFAAVGGWVSVFGESEYISGGLPLVSRETNIIIARCVFGAGAVVCLLLLRIAMKRAVARLSARASS